MQNEISTQENPKVSVIVPVYNVEPYIRRCLDSLVNQTLKDIEIICINDASPDKSLDIMKEYALKDPRIKIIDLEKNQGAAVARNHGLDAAKGEYLGFVDPDDAVDLNFYEELYKAAKEHNVDVVKGWKKNFRKDGTIWYSDLNDLIRKRGVYFFCSQWKSAIYKAALLVQNDIRFPDELRNGEDLVFLFRITLLNPTIHLLDHVYYHYHRRDGSLDADQFSCAGVCSKMRAIELVFEYLNQSGMYESNSKLYLELYKIYHGFTKPWLIDRNCTREGQYAAAQGFIKFFYMCKDQQGFSRVFQYPWMLSYIKSRNVEGLANELYKRHNPPAKKPVAALLKSKPTLAAKTTPAAKAAAKPVKPVLSAKALRIAKILGKKK